MSDSPDKNNITARFKGRIGGFDLDVAFSTPMRGVTALFGASGCGKTTVLRCIAGLEHLPDGFFSLGGKVWQDKGRFTPVHKRPLGYVSQNANLFPHLSVRANLLFGHRRRARKSAPLALDEVVELLALGELLHRSPRRLSGGERQRVAMGRALLSAPEILLMDEPLAALDRFAKSEIMPFLERLHAELELPVLYVSHDLSEIEHLADHMVLLDKGSVKASGPLFELLASPELPLARMPDAASVLEGEITAYDETYGLTSVQISGVELLLPGRAGETGARQRLRINASDVALCRTRAPEGSSILNGPPVRIIEARQTGPHQMTVFLSLGEGESGAPLLSRITRKSWDRLAFEKGELVHALIKSVALAR